MYQGFLMLYLILTLPAVAGQDRGAAAAAPVQFPALRSTATASRDYALGAGDLIEIKVFGVDELSQTTRVNSSGTISLPLVGVVEAAGHTATDIQEQVTGRLSEQKLVRDPQVTVLVKEYRSQPIYVLGAVNKPGQYIMTGQIRLIDAITLAGGLDPLRFGDTVLVKHQPAAESAVLSRLADTAATGVNVEEINLQSLLEKADASHNVLLRVGDIVHVTERKSEVFYVVGDVGKAGAFEFPRDKNGDLSISQAVVWAGGPTKTAKTRKGFLVRQAAGGGREQLAVDFPAILRGKKPDFPVRPNDIIYIPGSTGKSLAYSFAQAVPWALANGLVWLIP